MSIYFANIHWQHDGSDYLKRHYSRVHSWQFDGGITVPASASPHVVPLPMSSEAAVDPEEAFVASLSSCHMLFFLDFASRAGIRVEKYVDQAEGILEKNREGQMVMTKVTLNPKVQFKSIVPDTSIIESLHHQAHEACFLANSVKTRIIVNL